MTSMKVLRISVLLGLLIAVCSTGPTEANKRATPPNFKEDILALVNQFRSQAQTCGGEAMPAVPPLTPGDQLNQAAQLHTEDMVKNNFFDHTGSNSSSVGDRVSNTGYNWGAVGENIAQGSATAQATMDQWINSPGHCKNMMSPDFTQLGVGYAENAAGSPHWTQVFARPL
jgi:uncharacterized protein YkwD